MRRYRIVVASFLAVRLATGTASAETIRVPQDQTTIQAAINVARQLDTILVSPGRYRENIDFRAKLITVTSTNPEDPETVANTIIDGGQAGAVVTFKGIENSQAVLTGFTITGGLANRGGGILGNGAAPTISYCVVTGNIANLDGGGIADCHGSISHCTIRGNTSKRDGGGLHDCDGTISDCRIADNEAGAGAGGLQDCDGTISNCIVTGNRAGTNGGGILGCSGNITNCVISGNSTVETGGGLHSCNGLIRHCTITGNKARNGGGLYSCGGNITNCIIWDNRKGQVAGSSPPTYSDIQGGGGGKGSIDDNPLFLVPGFWDNGVWVEGDYHLIGQSPCIDTGDPAFEPEQGEKDLDGNVRVVDGDLNGTKTVDMGAYEALCGGIKRIKTKCRGNVLKGIVKSRSGEGMSVILTNDGEHRKTARLNQRGKGKARWRNQSGQHEVCIVGCSEFCRAAKCE